MSRTETPPASRLDLEALARRGPGAMTPCGLCATPTKSHILVDTGTAWVELMAPDPLSRLDVGTVITFVVTCHSCFAALDLPARRDAYEDLTARIDDDSDGVFEGVVG